MLKRLATWVVLVAFITYSSSCMHATRVTSTRFEDGYIDPNGKVLAVITREGEFIEFAEGHPGRIQGNFIDGFVADSMEVNIPNTEITRTIRNAGGRIVMVGTNNDSKYHVVEMLSESTDTLSFITTEPKYIQIPLQEVDRISARHRDDKSTSGIIVFCSFLIVTMSLLAMKDMTFFSRE